MRKQRALCLLIVLTFLSTSCFVERTEKDQEIENLRTFAKLYGYVRFFHPADKAHAIQWDRFAIHGVEHIKNAKSPEELKKRLTDLFRPVAPTVQIYRADKKAPAPHGILTPEDTTGLKLVSWQHLGFGFGTTELYKSIRLNRPSPNPDDPLFKKRAEAGEVIEKPLGNKLAAQVPLALFSKEGQTLRPEEVPSLQSLRDSIRTIPGDLSGKSQPVRYADVIITWNIFQHFYSYFNEVEVDWDEVLTKSLMKASDDETSDDFLKTLKWMIVQLKDAHGSARLPYDGEQYVRFPFRIAMVEGKMMITEVSTTVNDACYKQGDVITSVNGEPADQWLKNKRKWVSGTPQWKTAHVLLALSYGPPGEEFTFGLRRPGETVSCKVIQKGNAEFEPDRPRPIEEIKQGIYYVDIRRAPMKAIEKRADSLAAAEGIIFDLRGYPNRNHQVLQHLSKDSLRSARFMKPQFIYPDQMEVSYDTSGRWTLPPRKPYFSGKKVFLANKRVMSYAESVMGIVEHYDLAEIVGETTAGTNGDITTYSLPGKYDIRWTGMRVLKHDGSQHHLVGIKPTVPVKQTVRAVRDGRDEYLEKALELIRESP